MIEPKLMLEKASGYGSVIRNIVKVENCATGKVKEYAVMHLSKSADIVMNFPFNHEGELLKATNRTMEFLKIEENNYGSK